MFWVGRERTIERTGRERDSRWICLWVLVVATAILLVRKTQAFWNPQFWAEDGTIFFLQQYDNGAASIFRPYAGYLHLVPRTIALFADTFFAYAALPAVYNFVSFALTLLVIASFFSPRLSLDRKPLFALALVLIPHYSNEVFITITNLQWILTIGLVLLLLKKEPGVEYGSVKGQWILDLFTVVACGLTGPFILLLLPFFLKKFLENRNVYNRAILGVAGGISAVQLFFILTDRERESGGYNLSPNSLLLLLGRKVFGHLFLGTRIAHRIDYHLLAIAYFLSIFVLLKYFYRREIILFLGIHFMFLFATIYRFKDDVEVLLPSGSGERYFYIPYIMLAWCWLVALDRTTGWKRNLATVALTLIVFSAVTSGFRSGEFIDYNWKFYSESIGKKDLVIPINPKGWQITVESKK